MAKRIIIDGIDVSVCPEFAVSHDGAIPCGCFCKETPDCSFKLKVRLEEKEQECEDLKRYCRKAEQTRRRLTLVIGEYKEMYLSCLKQLKSKIILTPPLPSPVFKDGRLQQALMEIDVYIKEHYYCCCCEDRQILDHILNLIKASEGGNDVK